MAKPASRIPLNGECRSLRESFLIVRSIGRVQKTFLEQVAHLELLIPLNTLTEGASQLLLTSLADRTLPEVHHENATEAHS